jgi:hypothetical protein
LGAKLRISEEKAKIFLSFFEREDSKLVSLGSSKN